MDESEVVRIEHTNSTDLFEDSFRPDNQNGKRTNAAGRKMRHIDWDSRNSVMETLRHIQEENPQIEAIFLESDEGDDEDDDNAITIIEDSVDPIAVQSKKASNKAQTENNQVNLPSNRPLICNTNSPFTVREVSPYKIPSSLIQNSNTIALQEDSKGTTPKRYLVIPKEVVPIFANAKGPISLNVPGIGPLLIQKPSEIISGPNAQLDLQSCLADLDSSFKKQPKTPEYNPLCDSKFFCWRLRKGVKRDLDGFSMYDRLGFYKAEQRRGLDCAANLKFTIASLESSIALIKRKISSSYNIEFKEFANNKGKRGRKRKLYYDQSREKSNGRRRNAETETSDTDSSLSNDGLLLTRKVVVLNNAKSNDSTFVKKRGPGRPRKYPLPVHKMPGKPSPVKYSGEEAIKCTPIVKGKRGRPKKVENMGGEEKIKYFQSLYDITPCYILVNHCDIPEEVMENYVETQYPEQFTVIDNLKEFENKIDNAKPLLVVNEKQWGTLNLPQVSEANNMVHPVTDDSKIPFSMKLTAVRYNLRFVKPDILFRHLSGEKIDN
ncbi:uncharacterized protein LOC109534003 [Dendroctonus ponderosae]|uniref:uncharacterized protein LOC109534003 n=1 Tax=Dendroctonus ponderosae TaxID=77166 RepID=UPI0020355013|nr:uncharacterized protein LOC109534003 [Dendroctonus ponderosae]XP_019755099.2 uncharacterized protein LOC109534003 [Dendroctonus ponderosae]XP_019755100.2 uncharacterized protein LOC109534003 [Dendroctonus ponderosae]KAH1024008.1 hypothetical protein HUJ05_003575 [Dendroctonus ponderosae]